MATTSRHHSLRDSVDTVFRPCHGCHRHYEFCVCSRAVAWVIRNLTCPYCHTEFRCGVEGKQEWIQRCSNCWKAFTAVDKTIGAIK